MAGENNDKDQRDNSGNDDNSPNTNRGFYNIDPEKKEGENPQLYVDPFDPKKKSSENEKGAPEGPGAGIKNALNAEKNLPGIGNNKKTKGNPWDTNVGMKKAKTGGKNGKAKGMLSKGGPVAIIVSAFMLVGGFMFVGQGSMIFNLVELFRLNFDSISVSTALRSKYFLKFQSGEVRNPKKTSIFGSKFKITHKQEGKLKAEGIEKVEVTDAKGKKRTVFLFDDGSSTKTIIAPDDKMDLDNLIGTKIGADDIEVGKVMAFDDAYSNVADFRYGYNKASRTWKGSVGAWFDSITLRFIQNHKFTRNRFKGFQKRVQDEFNGNTKSATIDAMSKNADELEIKQKMTEIETETDEDGNTTSKAKTTDEDLKVKSGKYTKLEVETKIKELETKYKKGASSMAQMAANLVCTVAQFAGAISLLVAARETAQLFQIISSFTEAVDKVKGGEGSDSPIHVLSTALVDPLPNVSFSVDDKGNFVANGEEDDLDNVEIKETTSEKRTTAMQANAIAALFGNYTINQDDESVASFTLGGNKLNNIFRAIGASTVSFVSCSIAKLVAATVGAITDSVIVISCIASLGVTCIGQIGLEAAKGLAAPIALATGFGVASKILLPLATKALTRDLITDLGGEDLGNALGSGASMYLGKNHLTGGGSLTDKEGLLSYEIEHQKVIADNAEYERSTRSPFDITSQYTFLGSLSFKFASLYTSSYSPSGVITTIGNITRNSIASILPSASAVTASKMIDGDYNCPYLESIGAVGDAFCNPYIIDDVRSETISMHPGDVIDKVAEFGGFENDEVDDFTINKNSNLARYIHYCSERPSQFGVADQNIANDFSQVDKTVEEIAGDSKVGNYAGSTVNTAIGVIPIIGDAIDMTQNSNQLANAGWITGATCVANNTFNNGEMEKYSATPDWEEAQYYQRYLEDQRLMESMDPEYTSAVTAYLDEYYAENPIDDSYEGTLARYSGLTKENVIAVLNTIDYMNYIANYDPSTRHVFSDEEPEYTKQIYINAGNNVAIDSENVIVEHVIIYNDIRNRTATV